VRFDSADDDVCFQYDDFAAAASLAGDSASCPADRHTAFSDHFSIPLSQNVVPWKLDILSRSDEQSDRCSWNLLSGNHLQENV
jgi:hypothetical protein